MGKDTTSSSGGGSVDTSQVFTGALINGSSDIAVKDLDGKSKLIKNRSVRIRSAFSIAPACKLDVKVTLERQFELFREIVPRTQHTRQWGSSKKDCKRMGKNRKSCSLSHKSLILTDVSCSPEPRTTALPQTLSPASLPQLQ